MCVCMCVSEGDDKEICSVCVCVCVCVCVRSCCYSSPEKAREPLSALSHCPQPGRCPSQGEGGQDAAEQTLAWRGGWLLLSVSPLELAATPDPGGRTKLSSFSLSLSLTHPFNPLTHSHTTHTHAHSLTHVPAHTPESACGHVAHGRTELSNPLHSSFSLAASNSHSSHPHLLPHLPLHHYLP